VSAPSFIIWVTGVFLEFFLLWRLVHNGLWRVYPAFFGYVAWVVSRTVVLFGVQTLAPYFFRTIYWPSEGWSVAFRFLVIWELFRQTFVKGTALNRIASVGIALLGFGALSISLYPFFVAQTYAGIISTYAAIERSFGFVQAVLILGLLLMVRYYGVQLGRNVRGISLAFGVYAAISVFNYALYDLIVGFIPYWRMISPLSFVALFGAWTWAVWIYAPNPSAVAEDTSELNLELDTWSHGWNRVISSARKTIEP
jgi:hypothetical protein